MQRWEWPSKIIDHIYKFIYLAINDDYLSSYKKNRIKQNNNKIKEDIGVVSINRTDISNR